MINIKRLSILILLTFVVTSCFALPASAVTEDEVEMYLLSEYNAFISANPDVPFVKSIVGDQIIHIIITKTGGDIEFAAVTDSDAYITEITSGEPENPTLLVTSNEETVETIFGSDDPASETMNALNNGDITYKGVGIKNTIVAGVVKVGQFLANLLGLI
ncbi:MAG TPA: hypothetical protein C5S51_02995 [Methanosarcinaceae archaeon]|nr:hypothetical protein [Methanosarcinaceae archaeon]